MNAPDVPHEAGSPDRLASPDRPADTAVRGGPEPVVELRGRIAPDLGGYARAKVDAVLRHTRRAALHVHVRVVRHGDPARAHPVTARALVDLAGVRLYVHVDATTPREAVDLLLDRLDRRIAGTARGHRGRPARVPASRPPSGTADGGATGTGPTGTPPGGPGA